MPLWLCESLKQWTSAPLHLPGGRRAPLILIPGFGARHRKVVTPSHGPERCHTSSGKGHGHGYWRSSRPRCKPRPNRVPAKTLHGDDTTITTGVTDDHKRFQKTRKYYDHFWNQRLLSMHNRDQHQSDAHVHAHPKKAVQKLEEGSAFVVGHHLVQHSQWSTECVPRNDDCKQSTHFLSRRSRFTVPFFMCYNTCCSKEQTCLRKQHRLRCRVQFAKRGSVFSRPRHHNRWLESTKPIGALEFVSHRSLRQTGTRGHPFALLISNRR